MSMKGQQLELYSAISELCGKYGQTQLSFIRNKGIIHQQKLSRPKMLDSPDLAQLSHSDFVLSLAISYIFTPSFRMEKIYTYIKKVDVYLHGNQKVHFIFIRMSGFTKVVDMCMCVKQRISLNTLLLFAK